MTRGSIPTVPLAIAGAIAVVLACTSGRPIDIHQHGTEIERVGLPQPEGDELGDLYAIFTDVRAPSAEQLANCDELMKKLRKLTHNPEEIEQGARELVQRFPEQQHWCIYGKQLELERFMDSESDLFRVQHKALEVFHYVAPIARAFFIENNDPTYLDWASRRYRRISARIFHRPLDWSTEHTRDMLALSRNHGLRGLTTPYSVLAKYELLPEDPPPQPVTIPSAVPSAAPSAMPSATPPAVPAGGRFEIPPTAPSR